MLAGFSHIDITPSLSQKPQGSYRPRIIVGVHDPLLASAAVISSDTATVAIIGIDASCIMRSTFESAATMIFEKVQIPSTNLIVSASHTHAGGRVMSTFQAVADPEYAQQVARGIADAVIQAYENRAPAEFSSMSAPVAGIHFNRRFHMRDGRQVTHPGKMNPDIVASAGPVDDKIQALLFRKKSGEPLGIITTFGCHCTVMEETNEYSADYVYYLRKNLAQLLGSSEVVFLQGASGDVTQINNLSPEIEKGEAHAMKMGQALAAALAPCLSSAQYRSSLNLAIASRAISIPIRDRDYAAPPTLGLGSGDYWATIYEREKSLIEQMRKISPLATVTLANEYVGYIPTASAHYAGGYEPRLARSSYLAPEAAQQITEASLGALYEIK